MGKSIISTSVIIEVPFHDVDMMHVVWHGHYAKYLEIARDKLFETINYPVQAMHESGYLWPIIELRIRYAQPLRYQQNLRVVADLVEVENRLKIDYTIFDNDSGQRITKAHTIQVALEIESGEMLLASPSALLDRIRQ